MLPRTFEIAIGTLDAEAARMAINLVISLEFPHEQGPLGILFAGLAFYALWGAVEHISRKRTVSLEVIRTWLQQRWYHLHCLMPKYLSADDLEHGAELFAGGPMRDLTLLLARSPRNVIGGPSGLDFDA